MPELVGTEPSVFICYAKEDHAFAREVFAALRENGLAAWMDRPPEVFALEGILPGQDVALQIEQRLSQLSRRAIPPRDHQEGVAMPKIAHSVTFCARRRNITIGASNRQRDERSHTDGS